jgi:RNA polymerase sigma-70 factor (ECF subfamily)
MSPTETQREAFAAEALPHLAELLRFAGRLVAERTAAEDLVQETFLEAWRSFGRYQPGTNCRAWLYRILHRTAGRARRREQPTDSLDAIVEPADEGCAGEGWSRDVLAGERLRAAFASLADDAREVLLLADVEGYRYREIAERLELPIGTVMSRLSRARAALRVRVLAGTSADAAREVPAHERARRRWKA